MICLVAGLILFSVAGILLKIRTKGKNSNTIIILMMISLIFLLYFCVTQFKNDYSYLFIEKVEKSENVEESKNKIEVRDTVEEDELPRITNTEVTALFDVFKDSFHEIILSIIFMLITIILFNSSVLDKYCSSMRNSLFDMNHKWLSNKSLGEIMLSVEVYVENQIEEWDICEFFNDKFLKNESNIYFILGNPGEGKTVALHILSKMILDDYQQRKFNIKKLFSIIKRELKRIAKGRNRDNRAGRIPILLNFSEIKSVTDCEQFQGYIQRHIYKIAKAKRFPFSFEKIKPKMDKIIEKKLNQGKFVILLDGYDEIGETQRYELAAVIEEYKQLYPQIFFVIASRTAVIQNEKKYFSISKDRTLNLVPLTKEKVLEFLSNWNFRKPKLYWELYEKILGNHQLEKLAQNPLLLTLICYLFDISKLNMPENITEFYKEGTKCLLENWENEKRIFRRFEIDYDVKSIFLEKVAFYLYQKKEDVFSKNDIYRETKDIIDYGVQQKGVFNEIYLYSGIVEKVNDELFRFSHRSFYEFFLAKYLARNQEMVSSILEETEDYQIALFYLALTNQQNEIRKYISYNFDNLYVTEEIIIECQIQDDEIVERIVQKKLEKIAEYEDKQYYQKLGIIAGKYDVVKAVIAAFFERIFQEYISCGKTDELIYIIMGFSYFESNDYITKLLINYMGNINLSKLAEDSNLRLEQCLIALFQNNITNDEKKQLLDGLGKSSKYGTILNLLRKVNSDENNDIIIYQLLHETKKDGFVQWFDRQNFRTYTDSNIDYYVKSWIKEYGWKWNNEGDKYIENRYILVYYFLQLADYEDLDYGLISNRIKFVASYITSKEFENEPKAYYIDIPDCRIVSNVEFQFHWKKAKLLEDILYNPTLSKFIQWSVALFLLELICLQIAYINIEHRIILDECFKWIKYYWSIQDMDSFIKYEYFMRTFKYNADISRYIETNSMFIYTYICWTGIQMNLYKWYYDKPFNLMYNIFYIVIMVGFAAVFFLLFQDNLFRIIAVLVALMVFVFELSQHKNNMPSFREPQFQLIKDYLEKDIL